MTPQIRKAPAASRPLSFSRTLLPPVRSSEGCGTRNFLNKAFHGTAVCAISAAHEDMGHFHISSIHTQTYLLRTVPALALPGALTRRRASLKRGGPPRSPPPARRGAADAPPPRPGAPALPRPRAETHEQTGSLGSGRSGCGPGAGRARPGQREEQENQGRAAAVGAGPRGPEARGQASGELHPG